MTVTATLLVSAPRPESDPPRPLLITRHSRADTVASAWVRVYPDLDPADLTMRAIGGTLTRIGVREDIIEAELLAMNLQETLSPEHWPAGWLEIREASDAYDAYGDPVDFPDLELDADAGVIRPSSPVYGFAQIAYRTRYVLYRFTRAAASLSQQVLAFSATRGSATYSVPSDQNAEDIEVARVTSKYFVDPDGAWELPVDYATGGTTTYGKDGTSHTYVPADSWIFGRLHATIYLVRATDQPRFTGRNADYLEGTQAGDTYVYRVARAQPPLFWNWSAHPGSGYSWIRTTYDDPDVEARIAALDWDALTTSLEGLYPGIEVTR